MMNVIRIIMTVFPEKQKEVLQTLLSIVAPAGDEKGCLNYGVYSDIQDENVFNLISEWRTRRQLDHHMGSDRFGVLLGTKSMLTKPMEIQIYSVSDTEGMASVDAVRKKMKRIFPASIPDGV